MFRVYFRIYNFILVLFFNLGEIKIDTLMKYNAKRRPKFCILDDKYISTYLDNTLILVCFVYKTTSIYLHF